MLIEIKNVVFTVYQYVSLPYLKTPILVKI